MEALCQLTLTLIQNQELKMEIRKEIKSRKELFPVILFTAHALCFLFFWLAPEQYSPFKKYFNTFFNTSIVTLIYMYGDSKDWGFLARRTLQCLMLLIVINLTFIILRQFGFFGADVLDLYCFIFSIVLYACFVGIFFYSLCKR